MLLGISCNHASGKLQYAKGKQQASHQDSSIRTWLGLLSLSHIYVCTEMLMSIDG